MIAYIACLNDSSEAFLLVPAYSVSFRASDEVQNSFFGSRNSQIWVSFQKQDSDLVHIVTSKVPFCLSLLGAPPPWHTILARAPPLPAGQQLCEANL